MALVKSISGIRGTIGGRVAEGLSPVDVVRFVAAYATQRKVMLPNNKIIVVGRDARLSGEMVDQLVCGTLIGMGYDVINIGLATTPTTELAVTGLNAAGGSDKCINKIWYIHKIEYYSTIKKNHILIVATARMNFENMQNERNRIQKATYCVMIFI